LSLLAAGLLCGCSGGGGGGGGDGSKKSSVTITTNVAGFQVLVDGTAYTAPATFSWTVGGTHTVEAPSPQTSGADTYVWSSWSDGGVRAHSITVPSSATTYTATFVLQGAAAVKEHVLDSGGGEAVVDPYVTDHFAVHASVGQGAAHAGSGSTAGNGTTNCEAGFVGGSVAAEVGAPAPAAAEAKIEEF
jgi:hypothetical protein